MRLLSVHEDDALQKAVKVIQSGGIVAHPTETCYGLACDLTNLGAVEKLFALKQRPDDMPVSALFASIDEAKEWVEWNQKAQELAEKYLPGPLTIVLPAKLSLFVMPTGEVKEIGVRISSEETTQKLSELCDLPLSTTSANVSAQPPCFSIREIREQGMEPDCILDGGELPEADSSTVVRIREGNLEVLREGSIKL